MKWPNKQMTDINNRTKKKVNMKDITEYLNIALSSSTFNIKE